MASSIASTQLLSVSKAPQGASASLALKQLAGEFLFVIVLAAIAGVGSNATYVAVFLGVLWLLWLMQRFG